ncbi:hypothetical protein [Mesorhizobium sp. CAU 1741]|uniref:hypothetical protein n=1 Tax=Mesorhizobium sp. CAU 1741 TaxID=3140366 RepID=UPI00325A67F9
MRSIGQRSGATAARLVRIALCGIILGSALPAIAKDAQPGVFEDCETHLAASGLQFTIIEATDPHGYPGERGSLEIDHAGALQPVCLTWRYEDGSIRHGLGLTLAQSGVLAAFFGDGIMRIHVYRREGGVLDGISATASTDAATAAVRMTETARREVYDIDGGDRFTIARFRGEISTVTWHTPQGDMPGMALEHGAYLAAMAIDPARHHGLALYVADADGGQATGRWTSKGAWGVGTETLHVHGPSDAESFFEPNR